MKVQDMLIKRIENLCKEKSLSYDALSCRSTVPLTTLLHIMDGTTVNPGMLIIHRICDGLGVTMKEFFNSSEFKDLDEIK